MKLKYIIVSLACSSVFAQNLPASTPHNSTATWLTFDACGGLFDWKVANFLVDFGATANANKIYQNFKKAKKCDIINANKQVILSEL